jgi:prepilin-type N-terminal cleavage/methylation domain-containing protein
VSRRHSQQGFTLLELSVVLVIIGIVAASGLAMLTASIKQRQFDETVAKARTVQDALLSYRRSNGRLPCPGDTTLGFTATNFGIEGATGGTCTGGTPAATFSSGNVVAGLIPVKTLGLSDDYSYDGYGGRFLYVVDKRYTVSGAFVTYPITDTTNGAITVNDSTGAARTGIAVEALVSFGADQHGAYPYQGGSTRMYGDGSTNANEWENCGCNATAAATFNGTFVQQLPYQNPGTKTDVFDDIVYYKTRSTLRSPDE